MATIVEAAGAEYPATHHGRRITPIEGNSLAPVVQGGEQEPREAIYCEHKGNRAVRQGKWKLDFPGAAGDLLQFPPAAVFAVEILVGFPAVGDPEGQRVPFDLVAHA